MKRASRQNRKPQKEFRLPTFKLPRLDWKIVGLFVLAMILIIINFIVIPAVNSNAPDKVKRQTALQISDTVHSVLTEFGIPERHITPDDSVTRVLISEDFDFFAVYRVIRAQLELLDAEIIDCQKAGAESILMSVGKQGRVVDYFLFVHSERVQLSRGRAALIIDDFGYSFNDLTREFLTLDIPLTISIIPGLAYSKKVAEIAQLHRKEILVHMPMESLNEPYQDDGFTLISGQDPGMVSLRVRRAFAHLPIADGLNNHQGSKVTADGTMMQSVMHTLKSLNKFFIDSRTNVNSVAFSTAQNTGVASAENKLFIDTTDDVEFIETQLLRMANTAKAEGPIIAIGHVRPNTLTALERSISKLKTMGISFVYASDVVE